MKDEANKAETAEEALRETKSSPDSPELEFWQPSDERAELLVLLGGKGWTLICRRGGAIQQPAGANRADMTPERFVIGNTRDPLPASADLPSSSSEGSTFGDRKAMKRLR